MVATNTFDRGGAAMMMRSSPEDLLSYVFRFEVSASFSFSLSFGSFLLMRIPLRSSPAIIRSGLL